MIGSRDCFGGLMFVAFLRAASHSYYWPFMSVLLQGELLSQGRNVISLNYLH